MPDHLREDRPVPAAFRDLGLRLWRQGYQTATPILAAALASGHVEAVALVVALATAEAVTLFKAVVVEATGWRAGADTAWGWQLADRALPAAAGVFAGLGVTTWQDLLTVDWQQAASLAVIAALIAVADRGINPPAVLAPSSGDDAAGGA